MSSHPGCTLRDAVTMAEYLYKHHMRPEQVQDFYPTPGTVSTCMYYTGLDPYTLKPVYVAKTPEEKAMQRALLQYYEPRNAPKVRRALELAHREDLIGTLCPGRPPQKEAARRPARAKRTQPGKGKKPWHEGSHTGGAPRTRPARRKGK